MLFACGGSVIAATDAVLTNVAQVITLLEPDEFVRGFIKHLLSYALGRKLEYFDAPTVDEIHRAAAQHGYKFSAIVTGIVKSHPFRNVRNFEPIIVSK